MDPQDPTTFSHKIERLSTGRTYHFVDQIPDNYDPKRTPTLLCVHGFPDLWYGWRYQISPWVRKGSRVVVPDMLGYGATDKPQDSSEYSTKKLCADLAALLDLLGVRKAILVGHDWGSFTVGRFALWHPHRLLALIMMSVPYTPPSKVYYPIQEVARRAPNLGYQVYFADKRSTAEIEQHLTQFMSYVFRPPFSAIDYTREGALAKLLSNKEAKSTTTILTKKLNGGMQGPLNYYRTSKYRHDEELESQLPSNLRADLPVLFLWGTKDATATPFVMEKAGKFIPRLQQIALQDRGHWIMVEAKEDVTNQVIIWLEGLTAEPKPHTKL
ncbi:epoxide hydrolase [Infundibulicybe gibba]|nr:epoxide hydrolase [Infundibulicybe gibba]